MPTYVNAVILMKVISFPCSLSMIALTPTLLRKCGQDCLFDWHVGCLTGRELDCEWICPGHAVLQGDYFLQLLMLTGKECSLPVILFRLLCRHVLKHAFR